MRARLLAMMTCAATAATLGSAAATAGGASASKAPPVPLAIGGVEVTGAPSKEYQSAITRAVRVGLGAPETGPDVATCITADCLRVAATAAQAQRVLAVSIQITGTSNDDYAIVITIADHEGRTVRRRVKACLGCPLLEANEHVTALVSEIATAPQDDQVAVEIATRPAPVALVVDGVDRGRAPWSGTLPAGSHHVVAGPIDHPFFLEVTGEPQRIEVEVPMTPGRGRRFGPLVTYGTAAAGAGLVVLGAVLLARDGEPTCPTPSCPELHDTAVGGWISVGVGAAAIGAAGYFFWHDRRASQPVFAVVPTGGGAAAFATGRF